MTNRTQLDRLNGRPIVQVNFQPWKITTLPGGKAPVRGTEGAVGYDVFTRAIVDVTDDERFKGMRKTLWDFDSVCHESIEGHKGKDPETGNLSYVLQPGESVRIGIGFLMELPKNQGAWVEPRSGSANRFIDVANSNNPVVVGEIDPQTMIKVVNARVPIDPDFRGEASALLMNIGQKPFFIFKHKRIVQIVRRPVYVDDPIVDEPMRVARGELSETSRGCGNNHSTGI